MAEADTSMSDLVIRALIQTSPASLARRVFITDLLPRWMFSLAAHLARTRSLVQTPTDRSTNFCVLNSSRYSISFTYSNCSTNEITIGCAFRSSENKMERIKRERENHSHRTHQSKYPDG